MRSARLFKLWKIHFCDLITNWPWTCPQVIFQRPKSKGVFNGDFCNVQGYILEIETFFSHDSTALVCLVIVDILLFIMIMICDQWTVALQERSIVTVSCRANIAIVITANANTVTVLRDMVIAINYLHIISSNYCWTTREMNNIL